MMLTRFSLRAFAVALAMFCAPLAPASAQSALGLQVTLPDQVLELSLETLDTLPQAEFVTSTIWTDGPVTFSGVPLKALLAHLAATGQTLEMVALNDYAVAMPLSELADDAPLLATRINGAAMSVRDKGPFWVVYPYDRDPMYQTETVYSRSIWQLNRLNVLE